MKVGGIEATKRGDEILVLPRKPDNLVFIAAPVEDFTELNALLLPPTMPGMLTRDGFVPDPDQPAYRKEMARYRAKRMAYIYFASLEKSNIEWDSVKLDDPNTWTNWEKDLLSFLTPVEFGRVKDLCDDVNSLSQTRLDAAREDFFRRQYQSTIPTTNQDEAPSTQSGEPANVSESDPQVSQD